MLLLTLQFLISCCTITECRDQSFISTADDFHWIYVDGYELGSSLTPWDGKKTITVGITKTAKLIAVKVISPGNPGGFIGSLSDGIVTDSSWKCSRTYSDHWNSLNFSDYFWLPAIDTTKQGEAWPIMPNISINAKWIWADKSYYGQDPVYFRKEIGTFLQVMCLDK